MNGFPLHGWPLWVIGGISCALVELLVPSDFFLVFVGAGCLSAAVCSLLGLPVAVQFGAVGATALALFVTGRPLVRRYVYGPHVPTNAEALIGQSAEVLEETSPRGGLVRFAGETWKARSLEGVLKPGTKVLISAREGLCLVVRTTELPISVNSPRRD